MNQPESPPPWEAPPPPPPPEKYPFWNYLDVLAAGAVAVQLLLIVLLPIQLLFLIKGWNLAGKVVPLLLAQFLFYLLWFLFLYGWIRLRYGRPFWRSLAWVVPRQGLWSSFTWGLLTAGFVIGLGAVVGYFWPLRSQVPLLELLRDRVSMVLVGAFAVTLGPLCEELAFRGFLQPLLVRSLTAVPGILLTALLFASLHGSEYGWSWQHLLLITVAGVAFGWMRHRSGSTATSAAMHSAYNLAFFVVALAQRTPQ